MWERLHRSEDRHFTIYGKPTLIKRGFKTSGGKVFTSIQVWRLIVVVKQELFKS